MLRRDKHLRVIGDASELELNSNERAVPFVALTF